MVVAVVVVLFWCYKMVAAVMMLFWRYKFPLVEVGVLAVFVMVKVCEVLEVMAAVREMWIFEVYVVI